MTLCRVAAHVHSNWSYDGTWQLAEIAAIFRRRGYDAVLMVEHDRGFSASRWAAYQAACESASDGILLVPGLEYEDGRNVVHTAVWADRGSFIGESKPTLEVLRAAASEGAVSIFAHPSRRLAIAEFTPEWTPLLTAIEIWNRKYDGFAPRPGSLRLAVEQGLPAFAALDFHTRRQLFPLAMVVELDGALTKSELLAAIRARRFAPEMMGLPATRFAQGVPGAAARGIEAARRQAAAGYRAWRRAAARPA